MHGPSKQRELTPEELAKAIPAPLKELRELTLAVLSTDLGKNWLTKMKDYYIMTSPVAAPEYPASYCRFREGQNSLLRAIEIFGKEEAIYNQYMSQMLLNQGRMN